MWRVLETQLRKLLTGHEGGNAGYRQGVSYEFVAPALDPTSRNFASECQPVNHRSGVMASVRQRKRSDQNPVLLTIALKGFTLNWCVNASHIRNATGLRLAAKTSGFRIRRIARSDSGPTNLVWCPM